MDTKRLVKDHKVKWLYDDCKNLDDMLERLKGEIISVEEAQDLNVKISESKAGWCHLYCDVKDSNTGKIEDLKEKILQLADKKTLIKIGISSGAIILFLIIYYAILNPIVEKKKVNCFFWPLREW